MPIWQLLITGLIVMTVGVVILRNLASTTKFMRDKANSLSLADKDTTNYIFRKASMTVAGVAFIVVGAVFAVVSIIRP